jgi:hypothetical protein
MIYLKSFNEELRIKKTIDQKKLEEFCGDYLAYLTDQGFRSTITTTFDARERYSTMKLGFDYRIITIGSSYIFDWDDVKDYVIPFLQVLDENYRIYYWLTSSTERKQIRFRTNSGGKYISYEDVINDNVNLEWCGVVEGIKDIRIIVT